MKDKKRIYVVDDDRRTTSLIERILTLNGYLVKTENVATLAASGAQSFRPDLVLLDLKMPFKDGGDVAQELRSLFTTSKVPIIFVTGMVDREQMGADRGFIGGQEYIAKPFGPKALLSSVREKLPVN